MDFLARSDQGYLLEDSFDQSTTTPLSIYSFQSRFSQAVAQGDPADVTMIKSGIPTQSMPKAILQSWGDITKAQMSFVLYRRLVQLANAKDGWRGYGSKALDAIAIKNFLRFWTLVRENAAEPEISLAPNGTLLAEWRKSDHHRLDVRFAPRLIIFGLLTPKNIIEGADNMSTVATILKLHPLKPLSWRIA